MKLAILIINWNGKPLLNKCLNSISHQTIKSIPVYVVDNGSSDESIKFIQKNYPFVKIIPSKENLGFAQGNNLGISSIVEDYIFTLNNDTILDKYCIKNIIYEIKKNRDIGMFSLRMLRPSGEIDTLGIHLNYFGFSKDIKNMKYIKNISGPCGGAAVYNKKMLEIIKDKYGYFDSRFFLYYEDVDLIWRARNKGYKFKYISKAIVYHHHGKSTVKIKNTSLYLFIRNRIFCFNKNIHGFNKLLKSIPFIFMNLIVLIKYLFTNKFNIVIMAIFDGFLNKSKPINYILNKYG